MVKAHALIVAIVSTTANCLTGCRQRSLPTASFFETCIVVRPEPVAKAREEGDI
jgi:hypothetical protein